MRKTAFLILLFIVNSILFGQNIGRKRKDVIEFYDTCRIWTKSDRLFTKLDSTQDKVSYRFNFDKWQAITCFYFNEKDICYKQVESNYPDNLQKIKRNNNDTLYLVFYKKSSIDEHDFLFYSVIVHIKKDKNKYIFSYSLEDLKNARE